MTYITKIYARGISESRLYIALYKYLVVVVLFPPRVRIYLENIRPHRMPRFTTLEFSFFIRRRPTTISDSRGRKCTLAHFFPTTLARFLQLRYSGTVAADKFSTHSKCILPRVIPTLRS